MSDPFRSLQPPMFAKHTDVAGFRGNTLVLICDAMATRINADLILGAQQVRGVWYIYVKSMESRTSILTHGISVNGRHITIYDSNPYENKDGEHSEKIVFKGLPFEIKNMFISDYLKPHTQVETRSNVIYAKEINESNVTSYYNGQRYVFCKGPIDPPLPKQCKIDGHTCFIWHRSQNDICLRCQKQSGHKTSDTDNCPSFEPTDKICAFRHPDNPLGNYFKCDVYIGNQKFTSAEHAWQWAKCVDAGRNDLADEVKAAKHPRDAKKIAESLSDDELRAWREKQLTAMEEVLHAKAKSSHLFRQTLLATGKQYIAEGTRDLYWGCGLEPSIANTTKIEKHPGLNKLAHLLMGVRENLQQKVDTRMKDFHETQQKKQQSADEQDQLPLNLVPESSSEKATTSGETPLTTDDMNSQLLTAANLLETSVLSGCIPKVPTSSSNVHESVTSVDTSEVSSDVKSNDDDNQNSDVTTANAPRKQLHEQVMQAAPAVPHGEMTPKSHDVVKGTPKRKQNFSPDETLLDKKKCTPAGTPSTSPTATPVKKNISARDSNIKSEAFPSEDEKI